MLRNKNVTESIPWLKLFLDWKSLVNIFCIYSLSYTVHYIWESCQKMWWCNPVGYQPRISPCDVFYPLLFSSRLCLHLTKILYVNFILGCEESPRNKVWLTPISTEGNSWTPSCGPCSSKAHVNFSGNSAKSKVVKRGSVVSNHISSVCLCLVEFYTGWHVFAVFNHL